MVGSILSFFLVTPTIAAAPEDNYPQGEPAPGQTCPNALKVPAIKKSMVSANTP